jgi:hypothetical protein
MEVGDKVVRYPTESVDFERERSHVKKAMSGRVVYIHPKGRFHTVEFETPFGRFRESFWGVR